MPSEFVGAMEFPFGLLSAPLTFEAPTFEELRLRTQQTLRDPDGKVISADDVVELLRDAFVEVSLAYPKQVIDSIVMEADTFRYQTYVDEPFRVELVDSEGIARALERNDAYEGHRNGWDHYLQTIFLTPDTSFTVVAGDEDATDILRVWGYARRFAPTSDHDVCDVDDIALMAVMAYARLNGYQRLVNDRALFSQWNSQPGNSDVTLPQLLGMAQVFSREWEATRKRLRAIRRA